MELLTGEHDFAAFHSTGSSEKTTTRILYEAKSYADPKEPALRHMEFTGNGFLYNMVRIIAGTLLDVGLGRKSADDMPAIIESRDRRQAGPTLPACGLLLVGYEYDILGFPESFHYI